MAYCIDCQEDESPVTLVVMDEREALEEIDRLWLSGCEIERIRRLDGAPVTLFELNLLATGDAIKTNGLMVVPRLAS